MTYIEKLMSAVKFDDEMLTGEDIKRLKTHLRDIVTEADCPEMYESLRKYGAPGPVQLENEDYGCEFAGGCELCWAQEIEQ